MKTIVLALILISLGLYLVLFRALDARKSINFQNKYFGFNFGKKVVTGTSILNFIGGGIFIVVGVLTVIGIVEFDI